MYDSLCTRLQLTIPLACFEVSLFHNPVYVSPYAFLTITLEPLISERGKEKEGNCSAGGNRCHDNNIRQRTILFLLPWWGNNEEGEEEDKEDFFFGIHKYRDKLTHCRCTAFGKTNNRKIDDKLSRRMIPIIIHPLFDLSK